MFIILIILHTLIMLLHQKNAVTTSKAKSKKFKSKLATLISSP